MSSGPAPWTVGVPDQLSRPSVAISGGNGFRPIFDARTGALLAGVAGAVVAAGRVNSIDAVPAHGAAIKEPSALHPPRLTGSPAIGTPGAVFTIPFPDPAGAAAADLAPRLVALDVRADRAGLLLLEEHTADR